MRKASELERIYELLHEATLLVEREEQSEAHGEEVEMSALRSAHLKTAMATQKLAGITIKGIVDRSKEQEALENFKEQAKGIGEKVRAKYDPDGVFENVAQRRKRWETKRGRK